MESVERTVRMIRSKGVGVFFVTQHPTDMPELPSSRQLGNRVPNTRFGVHPERRRRASQEP